MQLLSCNLSLPLGNCPLDVRIDAFRGLFSLNRVIIRLKIGSHYKVFYGQYLNVYIADASGRI